MFLKALMQKHRKYRVFSKNIVNTVLLSTTAWKNIGIYGVSCFRGWRNDVNSVFFWGLGAKKVESSDISDNLHPLRVYFVFGILSNYLEGSPTQVVETERNHVVLKWKLQNLYVKTWPPVFFFKAGVRYIVPRVVATHVWHGWNLYHTLNLRKACEQQSDSSVDLKIVDRRCIGEHL